MKCRGEEGRGHGRVGRFWQWLPALPLLYTFWCVDFYLLICNHISGQVSNRTSLMPHLKINLNLEWEDLELTPLHWKFICALGPQSNSEHHESCGCKVSHKDSPMNWVMMHPDLVLTPHLVCMAVRNRDILSSGPKPEEIWSCLAQPICNDHCPMPCDVGLRPIRAISWCPHTTEWWKCYYMHLKCILCTLGLAWNGPSC